MIPLLDFTSCPWHKKASPELPWLLPEHPPSDQTLGLVCTSGVTADVGKDRGTQTFINALCWISNHPKESGC